MAQLPADLPENWASNQTVTPNGTEAGLSPQHGYNYLMRQVNATQRAVNGIPPLFVQETDPGGGPWLWFQTARVAEQGQVQAELALSAQERPVTAVVSGEVYGVDNAVLQEEAAQEGDLIFEIEKE